MDLNRQIQTILERLVELEEIKERNIENGWESKNVWVEGIIEINKEILRRLGYKDESKDLSREE